MDFLNTISENRTIEHLFTECKLHAMLIPYGIYKNKWALQAQKGELLETIDEEPVTIRVVEKTIIPINSNIAQCVSMLIYKKPIEQVFSAMIRNWKHDIQRKNLIFIIYEPVESKT